MLTPSEEKRASERFANIQKEWQNANGDVVELLLELSEALKGGDNK